MPLFTVDRRKGEGGFEWNVLRDGVSVYQLATYLQAFRIVQIANENAVMDEEKIARLQSATIGESLRPHAAAAVRARRYS